MANSVGYRPYVFISHKFKFIEYAARINPQLAVPLATNTDCDSHRSSAMTFAT